MQKAVGVVQDDKTGKMSDDVQVLGYLATTVFPVGRLSNQFVLYIKRYVKFCSIS